MSGDLNQCGFSASKLWNVARYYTQGRWDEDGEIPDDGELKSELKEHERYRDLHSQSSQRVLEELAESFTSWYKARQRGDEDANPPGYRKHGDNHPRSTVTWKQKGIKHDPKHNHLRLFKGFNHKSEGENGPSRRALRACQKLSRRKDHFLHALAKHIVERCIDHEVGRIAIGNLSKIREAENGEARNWGKRGNKKLHGWAFDRFATLLEYKAEEHGILVERKSERDTSKTCSCCEQKRDANRVERGLYVCASCGGTMNADVNGAVNIRRKITQNPPTEDMSNGRLARPVTYLFNQTSGSFHPREQVGCEL
ncbi:transposase, IS605 OrfB family, central region [Halogranum amylolyticum]|uniref:Transposase, IS605 OrfB family, central region n=1 Tax=Halogranum amylolyticum TaxID=660520 RepID=A0A1H8MQE0_9EURY|nr:transposase, IS605 OrfB family, central region [Halogranum amylolyticum]